MILDFIIIDPNSCNFSQYILAMSIIKVAFEREYFFDKTIFKNIYGVDLSKKKYVKCSNMIKGILTMAFNSSFNINCNNKALNNCNYINNSIFIKNLNNDDGIAFCFNEKHDKNNNGNLYNNEINNNKIIIIDSNINDKNKNSKYKCDLVQKSIFINNSNKIIINNNFINNSIKINNYNIYLQNYLRNNNNYYGYIVNTLDY